MINPKKKLLYDLNQGMKKFFGPCYNGIQKILESSNVVIGGNMISNFFWKINLRYYFESEYYFIINGNEMDQLLELFPDLDTTLFWSNNRVFKHVTHNKKKIKFAAHNEKFENNPQYQEQKSCIINDNGLIFIDYQKLFEKIEFPCA